MKTYDGRTEKSLGDTPSVWPWNVAFLSNGDVCIDGGKLTGIKAPKSITVQKTVMKAIKGWLAGCASSTTPTSHIEGHPIQSCVDQLRSKLMNMKRQKTKRKPKHKLRRHRHHLMNSFMQRI